MLLPKDILSGTYIAPRVFLCEVDKEIICQLEATARKGTFKFNSLSEISFEVNRTYNDVITGETVVNPHYQQVEYPRQILLEGFGYFELQGSPIVADGVQERKVCTAYSSECILASKFIDSLHINTGTANSIEVAYAETYNSGHIIPVTLYNPSIPQLSLLDIAIEKAYGWTIGYVDPSLKNLSRSFEIDRTSVYDFLMNDICEKFNCYIVFDTFNNTINIYAESLTARFTGDGKTTKFSINPPFSQIGTVAVNGYKTTRWSYDAKSGMLTLLDAPEDGAFIEVVDDSLTPWETDVFITFDNLAQEAEISYDSESIKTLLTVTYGEDGDIRETNLGIPYLVDLSYYCTPDWMGQDLYDAYVAYQQKCNKYQVQYADNVKTMLEIASKIDFEEYRQSLQYALADNVASDTVGAYYIRGGSYPDYYYTEVSLPAEYNANTIYYKQDGINLTEDSAMDLYYAIEQCYLGDGVDAIRNLHSDDNTPFAFMDDTYSIDQLADDLEHSESIDKKDQYVDEFLRLLWKQVGRTPLKMQYLSAFKEIQVVMLDAGHADKESDAYPSYYLMTLFLDTINSAITDLDTIIISYKTQYDIIATTNMRISQELQMDKNFTQGQLIRLNAFMREDELHIEDILDTDQDSITDSFKVQQDAMETGRIELSKCCQPQLQFTMSMANIYALPEFEPIVGQFQLGKVIKVGIRPDYKKQSRLMQVDIDFDDFSNFSAEFGELTSLRNQSDIHADLLSQTISAGKSVAENAAYWTQGSAQSMRTQQNIEAGLLDAVTSIKSIDGTQGVEIDKYGVHLKKVDPVTGEVDPKQGWITNNKFLYTDDGFKTTKSVFGEFTYNGTKYYGIIAEALVGGYVSGSAIEGGTINIGNGAFKVDANGSVTMSGGPDVTYNIDGYATDASVDEKLSKIEVGGAVSFEIFSTSGYSFNENINTIQLNVSAMYDSKPITEAKYTWYYLEAATDENSGNEQKYIPIAEYTGISDTSIVINKSEIYATLPLKCDMTYSGKTYSDYVLLSNTIDIYNASIRFLDGRNTTKTSLPYVVAYVNLYKNNTLVESVPTNKYCASEDIVVDGTTIKNGPSSSDDPYMYFIYKNNNEYAISLGQYVNGNWQIVVPNLSYSYNNNFNTNKSNVVLISREHISTSGELVFNIQNKDGTYIAQASEVISDVSDTVVSDIVPVSPRIGQVWVDTSVSPNILKVWNGSAWIQTEHQGSVVYTTKPDSYKKDDLWVLSSGSEEFGFEAGTILRAKEDSDVFNKQHWIDTDEEATEMKKNIKQYFSFDVNTGLRIGQKDNNQFYVNIDATEMGFYDNTNKQNKKVVSIGNESATIQNATLQDDVTVNGNIDLNGQLNVHGTQQNGDKIAFVWKIESNGSYSLAIGS